MRLELTSRDQKLFQIIDSYGLLSTKQIRKIIFPGIDQSVVLRRLRILKLKKYIQSYSGLPKGELVWTLSLKARQLINSDLEVTVNKNQLEHDVLISEVRLRLEQNNVCHSWVSGFKLKQLAFKNGKSSTGQATQTPDGIFSVKTSAGIQIVALELETSSKTKKRYRDILKNHASNAKVNWVWYVITQKSLGSFLCATANQIEREDKKKWLFTSNLSDVLNPHAPVILYNPFHSITFIKGDQSSGQGVVR